MATAGPEASNRIGQLARFLPVGDTAFAVEFGSGIDPLVNARVHRAAALIDDAGLPGIVETVPTFRSLLIHYDPLTTSAKALQVQIADFDLGEAVVTAPERIWVIPTLYGGEAGPDLAGVAAETSLGEEEVVARHSATVYRVFVQGFLPGFAYLGVLPSELELPRLASPRVRVPPGSVAIAQRMTGVYPVESPGGWRLIGNTPLSFFDPHRTPPTLFAPGDGVRFRPVSAAEHADIREAVARGTYQPEQEPGR